MPMPPIPSDTYYRMKFVHSDKCMAVENSSTNIGTNIVQQFCDNSESQLVKLSSLSDEYFTLEFKHSGQVIDVSGENTSNGASVIQWPNNGQANQLADLMTHDDGTYSLKFKHSNRCMDVSGANEANGVNVIQWSCHYNSNQRFRLEPAQFECNSACQSAEIVNEGETKILNTTDERWFVVSDEIFGWQASEISGRTIKVNGIDVNPGEMPLPNKIDGKYYFYFSQGDLTWASWSFWNW